MVVRHDSPSVKDTITLVQLDCYEVEKFLRSCLGVNSEALAVGLEFGGYHKHLFAYLLANRSDVHELQKF